MVVVIHMVIWLDMVDVSDSWNIIIILVDNVVGIRQVSMREIGINILFRKRSVGVFCLVFTIPTVTVVSINIVMGSTVVAGKVVVLFLGSGKSGHSSDDERSHDV